MTTQKSGDAIMAEGSFAVRLGYRLGFNGMPYPVKGTGILRTGWHYGRADALFSRPSNVESYSDCHTQASIEAFDVAVIEATVNRVLQDA